VAFSQGAPANLKLQASPYMPYPAASDPFANAALAAVAEVHPELGSCSSSDLFSIAINQGSSMPAGDFASLLLSGQAPFVARERK